MKADRPSDDDLIIFGERISSRIMAHLVIELGLIHDLDPSDIMTFARTIHEARDPNDGASSHEDMVRLHLVQVQALTIKMRLMQKSSQEFFSDFTQRVHQIGSLSTSILTADL